MTQLVSGKVHWLDYSKTATKKELLNVIKELERYADATCFDTDYHRAIEINNLLSNILTQ